MRFLLIVSPILILTGVTGQNRVIPGDTMHVNKMFVDTGSVKINGIMLKRDTVRENRIHTGLKNTAHMFDKEFKTGKSFELNPNSQIYSYGNDSVKIDAFSYLFKDSNTVNLPKVNKRQSFLIEEPIYYLTFQRGPRVIIVTYYQYEYKYIAQRFLDNLIR